MSRRAASAGLMRIGLASGDLCRLRDRSRIHLAVQAAGRLVGDEMDRPLRGARAAEPLGGSDPGRMRRAIVIAEAGDRFGRDLDPAGRRLERMALGIAAKLLEQHEVVRRRRQLDVAFGPELLKAGQLDAFVRRAGANPVIDRSGTSPSRRGLR